MFAAETARPRRRGLKTRYLAGTAVLTLLAAPAYAQSIMCQAVTCNTDGVSYYTANSDGGVGGNGVSATISGPASMSSAIALTASSQGGAGWSSDTEHDNGGAGGNGGVASATNAGGIIIPAGVAAPQAAITAQADGGAGGTGATGWFGDDGSNGGAGGQGGSATATNSGTVNVGSNGANGIFVHANGGAGAQGGTPSVYDDATPGDGGAGNIAGTVSATNAAGGSITTAGSDAAAIYAVANGGAGAAGMDGGSDGGAGSSGAGAIGGSVTVTNAGTIATSGYSSAGIWATAYGGAGGAGGLDGDEGTAGAQGAQAGSITATNSGQITTTGGLSYGVGLSATGGAGGAGGSGNDGYVSAGSPSGKGGKGGSSSLTTTATSVVTVSGANSFGLYADANGGAGGAGGANTGTGGAGGDAGGVTLQAAGIVAASGANAPGIGLFAIGGAGGVSGVDVTGGAGGNGGTITATVGLSQGTQDTASGNASVALGLWALGGNGGNGDTGGAAGTGGSATAKVIGYLSTSGGTDSATVWVDAGGGVAGASNSSAGIIGGTAGTATAYIGSSTGAVTLITSTGSYSATVGAVAVGGAGSSGYGGSGFSDGQNGGGGGSGGTASVTTWAGTQLQSSGQYSAGIYAASDGGAGAAGGSYATGGNGGIGLVTTVINGATIATTGAGSDGIWATAFGGAGGGDTSTSGTSGGGTGGAGGSVTITNSGSISTTGAGSDGVAGSAGGGAGGASALYSGAGGAGGSISVTTTTTSQIITSGANSSAIFADASGGAAGLAVGSNGASGATGGAGGGVTVSAGGAIATSGITSPGILATSYGGAGAQGPTGLGGNGGAGGDITVTAALTLSGTTPTTANAASPGIQLVSQGGAGGAGVEQGNGGASGTATLAFTGTLVTGMNQTGAGSAFGSSAGLLVSAVGGAGASTVSGAGSTGGTGGAAMAASATVGDSTGTAASITTWGDSSSGVLVASTGGVAGSGSNANGSHADPDPNGGNGGLAGNAGSVTVWLGTQTSITTAGSASYGVEASSTGGAGGTGADQNNEVTGTGGNGGNGGTAGPVLVTSSAQITTSGQNAFGIYASATGGSGGNGGFSSADFTASGGHGGDGGGLVSLAAPDTNVVEVSNFGSITTSGLGGVGIWASAMGGNAGGGANADGGFDTQGGKAGSAGAGGNVEVTNASGATITTHADFAYGIVASSIGGGGAAGGSAQSGSPVFSVAVGGGASGGGPAGTVTVTNAGSITTSGSGAFGIYAQSVGGGGGVGGNATSFSLSAVLPSISVALGGDGGTGGAAAAVTITNSGKVETKGYDAYGLAALSVGGGGGNGGQSSATALEIGLLEELPTANVTVSAGGSGGSGGDGGVVTVTNSGKITTHADQSLGLFAYSIGGGGGAGGNAAAAGYTYGVSKTANVSSTVGGSGGSGGDGLAVTVVNDKGASIATSGYAADAIHALSVGGGGGNGGSGTSYISTSLPTSVPGLDYLPVSLGTTVSVSVAVGGTGGAGGTGGTVDVSNAGRITTKGIDARGILAQSIGGGGGSGASGNGSSEGSYSLNLGVGGSGGSGGDAAKVKVTNSGIISTKSDGAHGIHAQSVGGGGGSGGTSSAERTGSQLDSVADVQLENLTKIALNNLISYLGGESDLEPDSINASLNLSLGGRGGAAGEGGKVEVINTHAITTAGDIALGIFAQSIGGGGGNGGGATVAGGAVANFDLANGGGGGAAGNGGTVSVRQSGTITTSGETAYGILAESIGGGGGLLAAATDNSTLSINPSLDNGSVTLGGVTLYNNTNQQTEGASGNGGKVSVTNKGTISTSGSESHAIVAQSIGAGGGLFLINPGSATSNASLVENPALASLFEQLQDALTAAISADALAAYEQSYIAALSKASGSFALTIGGSAESQGNGGKVTVTNAHQILTTGDNAFGIVAQSIGGGGGLAGDGSGTNLNLTITGTLGGGNGTGGDVAVKLGAGSTISTTGTGAIGIFAQSIGGGGGYTGALDAAGMTASAFLSGSALSTGAGGRVRVETLEGASTSITTTGANAHGVFAQSLSGGGGAVGSTSGILIPAVGKVTARSGDRPEKSGGVDIDLVGTITATGANAVGIYAQSGVQGTNGSIASGGGKIDVTFTGTLTGGSGTGAAIWMDGGLAFAPTGSGNTITIGAGSVVSALSGNAIVAVNGTGVVNNSGTITGNVDFAWNAMGYFVNNASGVFNSGATVNLGGGYVLNYGTLSPGGTGTIATTAVTGNMSQRSTGTLAVDINASASSRNDLVTATGSSYLAGTVEANVIGALLPGGYTVLSSQGQLTQVSATATTPTDLGLVSWGVAQVGNTAVITPTVTLTPPSISLNANETAIAQHLQQVWNTGGGGQGSVFGSIARAPSASSYTALLDSFSPENVHAAAVSQTLGARGSMHAALSCPVFTTGTQLEESSCAWARVIGTRTDQEMSGNAIGYGLDTMTYRIGVQKEIVDDWFVGGTLGLTQSWLSGANSLTQSDGLGVDGSLSLKHQVGPWLFALAGNLGYGSYDHTRTTQVGGTSWAMDGSTNVLTAGLRLRAAYEVSFERWYVKPYADLDLLFTHMPGYAETGFGPVNVTTETVNQWTLGFSPHVEFGARVDLSPGLWLRPYAAVGGTFLSNDSLDVRATFQGGGAPRFTSSAVMPDALLDLGLGAQLFAADGYELRLDYQTQLGSDYSSQDVSARFAIHF